MRPQMIVWGTISAATAAVKNFSGLIAVRFFLGFVEAAYFVSDSGLLTAQGVRI
jgi:hypothetical protein